MYSMFTGGRFCDTKLNKKSLINTHSYTSFEAVLLILVLNRSSNPFTYTQNLEIVLLFSIYDPILIFFILFLTFFSSPRPSLTLSLSMSPSLSPFLCVVETSPSHDS
jgi:hypothetical protein